RQDAGAARPDRGQHHHMRYRPAPDSLRHGRRGARGPGHAEDSLSARINPAENDRGGRDAVVAYRIIRGLSRLLLSLFYRRIEVVGAERIPTRGPLIITANHHNSLVDPMLVMTALPRQLLILAAAPLFHNPVIGPFLRLVGALPVLRRQEGIGDPARNDAMFAS